MQWIIQKLLLFYQFLHGFLWSISNVGASPRKNGREKRLSFTKK